jgi:hypothetical protein
VSALYVVGRFRPLIQWPTPMLWAVVTFAYYQFVVCVCVCVCVWSGVSAVVRLNSRMTDFADPSTAESYTLPRNDDFSTVAKPN